MMKRLQLLAAIGALPLLVSHLAAAATLTVQSAYGMAKPQPGDVLVVIVRPAAGETLDSVAMSAFDTAHVKFTARPDGSQRAFLGFPFDRHAGDFPLRATAQVSVGGNAGEQNLSYTLHGAERNYPTQHITMQSSMAGTMTKTTALHAEKLHVQSTMQHSNPAPLWTGSWAVPVHGRATSSYGQRRYVNGKWWGQHNGADIRAGDGTPIYATNDGVVVLSEHLPTLRGNCTIIDHGANVFSLYLHQSQRLVKVGDRVRRGQLIGRVGHTGFVTGPHLHWEMRVGWETVDPFRIARYGLKLGG